MMTPSTPSPHSVPLPPSPDPTPSTPDLDADDSRRSSFRSLTTPVISPRTLIRPRLERGLTSATIRQGGPSDAFYESCTISVNQPVGSLSISPSSRDVCLASRKGLYILDLANLNNAPRFIPQGGTWQIADCQWSPHPATSNLILSTSSQKLLVWDLSGQKCLYKSIDAHARAITDINWHARNPHLMATVSMDAGIRGWDLRAWNRPVMRVAAWGRAGTQIKWNRQHDHLFATAHGKEVIIWDHRKGSVPVTIIRAHDAKIYGIDWDREVRHKLVTCSLDKTIKYWDVDEMAPSPADSRCRYFETLEAPEEPEHTISTSYPVWRARNLPFGHGVLALPQRGQCALDMFGTHSETPTEVFEGHDDVVKEFVWRVRGGDDSSFEDRDFQLITWSKDRTLRIWPVGKEITEKVGYKRGAPILVLQSRRGAADITYTRVPDAEEKKALPPPIINPSGISRQKMAKVETGMTRGGGAKPKGMDQLEWLTKVVKNKSSPNSSTMPSRIGSLSRRGSYGTGTGTEEREKDDYVSLKDEVVLVNKLFPRPKINFEKIDLHHRKLTMSLNGPWANGDRMAFMRIHWSFPSTYPYTPDNPTFELERNPTILPITRQRLVTTIKELRAMNRQCLVSTCAFLLGSHERVGRRALTEQSDSESEKDLVMSDVAPLIRTCGATFGPNGQLVCFFPKQTVLPRTRQISRSPSAGRDDGKNPLAKAISALSRLENPRHRGPLRLKPRLRRLENIPAPVQAGSTVTLHNVSHLGNPDVNLARAYGTCLSPETNFTRAMEAKRLDHAEIWAMLRGLLTDNPPPPYTRDPPVVRNAELRREREAWERGVARKRLVLQDMFSALIETRDVQLLAIVGCVLLDHISKHPPPPRPEPVITQSPEQDYFGLPRILSRNSLIGTPMRKPSRPSVTPISPAANGSQVPSSYRGSGWSQMILNPSSASMRHPSMSGISLRGQITPTNRTSLDIPKSTPMDVFDDSPIGLSIPVPSKNQSPRYRDRPKVSGMASASPSVMTTYRSSGTMSGASAASAASAGRSGIVMSGSEDVKPYSDPSQGLRTLHQNTSGSRVNFGSGTSPLRRNFSKIAVSVASAAGKKPVRVCSIRMELLEDETETPSLLDDRARALCEGFKLAYADFLLRCELFGLRTKLLHFDFIQAEPRSATKAAGGDIPLPVKYRGANQKKMRHVCVACASTSADCTLCGQVTAKPQCTYCRLPIKGLATTCTICNHRSHAKCFRAHFVVSRDASCPSCLCHCARDGGISGPAFAITSESVTAPTAAVTRGAARGSLTLSPTGTGSGRMTYASLKTIREQDQASEGDPSALGLETDGRSQTLPAPTVDTGGWLGWDPARLSWAGALTGHGEQNQQRGPRGRGGKEKSSARAKLGAFRTGGRAGSGG